jgi:hypothetical protein
MKLLVWLLLGLASLVPAADLPSGESLIRRSIEREGGAEAVDRAQTAIMTGTVEILGHNISGPLAIYQQGEQSYTEIELPGIGKVEEGFDGTVAWENSKQPNAPHTFPRSTIGRITISPQSRWGRKM